MNMQERRMRQAVYEFEVFKDGAWYVALPYDLEGGTQGEDFGDLCLMIADWLKGVVEDYAMADTEMPSPTFGNEPRHGGQNMVVAVSAGLDTVERVSAADAARALGVSPGRVSQMIAAAQLFAWREGTRTWITRASLEARLDEGRKAGRPPKKVVAP